MLYRIPPEYDSLIGEGEDLDIKLEESGMRHNDSLTETSANGSNTNLSSTEHFRELPSNNDDQNVAIRKALTSKFSMIQGPPG